MNKVSLLTILFSFSINDVAHAMQNGTLEPLVQYFKQDHSNSFNLDECKKLQKVSKEELFKDATIVKREGEEDPYLLFPMYIDEAIRPLILKKIEDAVEHAKTTFALSKTCTYMYVHLNPIIKKLEKKLIEELLFSDLNRDFYTFSFNYSIKDMDQAVYLEHNQALYLYNTSPNTLALMGKILVSKIRWQKTSRGTGDRHFYNFYSYSTIRTAFFNLLHAYIILTDEERMEKYNQLKGDIIKKLLKGVSSNEWHEIETRFIRGNKHYLLNNNPFIITEERIGQSNPIQNPIEKYFFMKK